MKITTGLEPRVEHQAVHPKHTRVEYLIDRMSASVDVPKVGMDAGTVCILELLTTEHTMDHPRGTVVHTMILTKEPYIVKKGVELTLSAILGDVDRDIMSRFREGERVPEDAVVTYRDNVHLLYREVRFEWYEINV